MAVEIENFERYKDASSTIFMTYILPTINSIPPKPFIQDVVHQYSFTALEPGKRFFPSSLALITAGAVVSNKESVDFTKPEFVYPAAAVELFHNSTLLHDDVIDKHTFRRNHPTVVSKHGDAASLLGGNYAVGEAIWLLAHSGSPHLDRLLDMFATAIANVNYGQLLDEKSVWDSIQPDDRMNHWHTVAEQKTIAGILACMVGTTIAGKSENMPAWYEFEKSLGIMSQVINDVGDVWSFTGYIETETSRRVSNEESDIKYTYPRLWYYQHAGQELNGLPKPLEILASAGFVTHAQEYVETLRDQAHNILHNLSIRNSSYKNLLMDFVSAPKLPDLHT